MHQKISNTTGSEWSYIQDQFKNLYKWIAQILRQHRSKNEWRLKL